MERIRKILRISAIIEFLIVVVSTIIVYLNNEQIINIHFLDIKMVTLVAIVLCFLVIIEEFVQIIIGGGKIVKKRIS